MDWPPIVVGFAVGLMSALIIVKVNERLKSEKALSERVYVPLHEQLIQMRDRVEGWSPFNELTVFANLRGSGLIGKVDRSMRENLEHLYLTTLLKYNTDWQSAQNKVEELRQSWDKEFGAPPPSGSHVIGPKWWLFCLVDEFRPPQEELGPNQILGFRNHYMARKKLDELGLTLTQFLRQRREQAEADPAIRRYKASRTEILAEIDNVLRRLSRKIQI